MNNIIDDYHNYIATNPNNNYKSTLYYYLRFIAPGTISDVRRAFLFLTSELDEEKKVEILSSCIETKLFLEENRSHLKNTTLDEYSTFINLYHGDVKITKDIFNKLYSSICGIEFNGDIFNFKRSSKVAIDELLTIEEPKNVLFQYLYKLYLSNSADYVANDFATNQQDYETKLQILKKVKTELKHNKEYWRDSICYLYYDSEYNDIELENKYVYQAVTGASNNSSASFCIIDPSPFFIKQWISDSYMARIKTTFVLSNTAMLELQKSIYFEDYIYWLKTSAFLEDSYQPSFSKIIIFGNHIENILIKKEIVEKLFNTANDTHNLYFLDSDSVLLSEEYHIASLLKTTCISEVDLLPANILNSTNPKRKMLLKTTFGYNKATNQNKLNIFHYNIVQKNKYQILSNKTISVEIDQSDLFGGKISPRHLFRDTFQLERAKTERTRDSASYYIYSNEIRFCYTLFKISDVTRIRVYASVLNKDTDKYIVVKGSVKEKRNINLSDITIWLEQDYAFSSINRATESPTSVRDAIADSVLYFYKGKTISFKTFLYCYPEIELLFSNNVYNSISYLAEEYIGNYDLSRISQDLLLNAIYQSFETKKIETSISALLSALQTIFNIAIKNEHCRFNPAKDLLINKHDRFSELDEVNDAVGKHFFDLPEIHKMITKCISEMHARHYEYLAVLFRITTGLEANIICGLLWKDVSYITLEDQNTIWQLKIERQVGSDGKRLIPFKRKEQVRTFPIPDSLATILLDIKNDILLCNPELPIERLSNMAIIPGDDIHHSLSTSLLSPARVNKLCKELIIGLNIPDNYLPIPDNKYGILDDNLNACRGDIFKNTFRHYLLRDHTLNSGEINYLLGIQAPNVDYGNYIDCTSDRIQLHLLNSLELINRLFNLVENND